MPRPSSSMPEEMEALRLAADRGRDSVSASSRSHRTSRSRSGNAIRTRSEVYVLVKGSARVKIEDEVVELELWDAVRIGATRCGTSKQAPKGPSTSPSVQARIPATRR